MRQYIGARYMPKFMGNYDPTQEYEALSVVDNGLGTSYICNKPTPAGTPLTNTNYWHIYGSTSGAIINLQNQIDAIHQGFETPQMYGAVGDGITDDSQAFINLLAGGNKNIIIPEGDYLISEEISVYSNTNIFCNGTLRPTITGDADNEIGILNLYNVSNVSLNGIKIVGAGAVANFNAKRANIYVNHCNGIIISNCSVEDTPYQYAIQINRSENVLVDNCYIENYTYGGIGASNGSKHVTIRKCSVIESVLDDPNIAPNSYPISVAGYDGSTPIVINEDMIVDGCYIENSHAFWEGIDFHGGNHVKIINNTVKGCACGVACAGTSTYTGSDILIANNDLEGAISTENPSAASWAIALSYAENIRVIGNTAHGFSKGTQGPSTSAFIYISTCEDIIIADNEFYDCGNSSPYGIYGTPENIIIKNNYFHDSSCIYMFRFYNSKYSVIQDNVIEKCCSYLVNLNGIDPTRTSYNKFSNNISDINTYNTGTNGLNGSVPQFKSTSSANPNSGHAGDIILNIAPSSGNPIGWICTSSADENNDAAWGALPNL